MSAKTLLPTFAVAVSHMAVQAAATAYPADYIVEHILKLSNYIINLAGSSILFGRPELDLYSPSLDTLFDRLQKKQLGPSLLPPGFLTAERIHARIYLRSDQEATGRPLADYEDLYYALVARMQEMRQLLNLRINSGFNIATQLVCEGGPSIAEFHNSLSEYWDVLNNPSCGKALDDAIREAKVQALRDELAWQVEGDNMSVEDALEQLKQLNSMDVYSGISGLNFVQDWAPTMVGAYLEQKYRHILDLEKEEATIKARQERRQAKVRSTRELPPGAPVAQKVSDRRPARTARKAAHDANTKARIEADHQYLPKEQAAMQYSPECLAELHPGRHYEEHSAAICEQNIANADDMLMLLEWQMKTQRVSEYSGYLRARASQESQRAVQSTQGSVTDSFVSSFSSTLPLGGSGGVIHHPDMNYSQYMQFQG
ncbi:hypothetical protein GT037_004352 [Alternaria burnsii]|uniref:Uncharacterized protein n=1 Tax=Alternaria burnsii TaxID=1187904 RepID=A0A8H7BDP2_9PLEO|nr:uncharacterized protein GT037_004352 [Alternaria burnsii]KAF7677493.1 hypothetical protein GT037_004352 [Alternaria burnsii]